MSGAFLKNAFADVNNIFRAYRVGELRNAFNHLSGRIASVKFETVLAAA
jgi:hypothetical protein